MIEDNGIGYVKNVGNQGLGTSIVSSLAYQLDAELVTSSNDSGTKVSLTYPKTKLF